jgi:hypothetical protein
MNDCTPIHIPLVNDEGDDLEWLARRADALEHFREWQRDGIRGLRECENNPREEVDFSDWIVTRAISDPSYLPALDWIERKEVERITGKESAA